MKKETQYLVGIILLVVVLLASFTMLEDGIAFRMLIGITFGYALIRSSIGFAGSVARMKNNGSTKLLRTMMFMFGITAIGVSIITYAYGVENMGLWVNPINLGLILGGTLFGFGMVLAGCCASGIMVNLATSVVKYLIAIFFFGMGVFLAFPLAVKSPMVAKSLISTGAYNGIYLPDLFGGGTVGLFLGTLLVLLALFVAYILFGKYENSRKQANTYSDVGPEKTQDNLEKYNFNFDKPFCKENYEYIFVRPWSRTTGAIVITATFLALTVVTRVGWGASTPYGMWFGKIMMLFGVSPEALSEYSLMPVEFYTTPFFSNAVSVQDLGIMIGALIYSLTAGVWKPNFKITGKEFLVIAFGSICIGVATRLANGCNVGALYTPMANLSLSAWIFLPCMIVGGYLGLTLKKKIM